MKVSLANVTIILMSKRLKLLLVAIVTLIIASLATVILVEKREEIYKPGVSAEVDRAVNQAKAIYEQKKLLGYDFSNGPCLTNDVIPDWVADLVHRPRQSEDNLPQNQCPAYLEGRAKHFVELDLDGNLVRVK